MRSFWTTSCISKYSNANSSNFHQCHPLLIRQSLWNVGQVYLQQRAFINHWVLRNHWKLLFDLVVYENQSQTKFSSTYDSSSYLWHHFSRFMHNSFCVTRSIIIPTFPSTHWPLWTGLCVAILSFTTTMASSSIYNFLNTTARCCF